MADHELQVIHEGDVYFRKPAEYTIRVLGGSWRYRGWVIYSAGWRGSYESIDLYYALTAARVGDAGVDRKAPGLYVSYPGRSGWIRWGERMDVGLQEGQEFFPGDWFEQEIGRERAERIEREQLDRMARLIDKVEDATEKP